MNPLPGFELPVLRHLNLACQRTLWRLGAISPRGEQRFSHQEYDRLIALGLIKEQDGFVTLTPEGQACIDAEIEYRLAHGLIFVCRSP